MLLYVCRIHGLSFLDVQWYAASFIAVSIILISFRCLLNRHYFLMLLLILLAASIHGSALLVLPILLIIYGRAWNKKTILLLMTVIMMILFVHPLTDIIEELLRDTQYNDIVTMISGSRMMAPICCVFCFILFRHCYHWQENPILMRLIHHF